MGFGAKLFWAGFVFEYYCFMFVMIIYGLMGVRW